MPRKLSAPLTAARKVVAANVASPCSHGIDRVERVIDTVEALHRRRQIDARQKQAADIDPRAHRRRRKARRRRRRDAVGGGPHGARGGARRDVFRANRWRGATLCERAG
jgi:spore cortex formation protein SpoVR/YcgB (stage V sporulation)